LALDTPHPNWTRRILKQLRSAKHRALIEVLVTARKAADLTQRQLASKLKRSNSFVWKFEAGERQLNVLEFMEIARTLKVKASVLMAQIESV
jgi:transcriptional regulator with XRE-family HTH domain